MGAIDVAHVIAGMFGRESADTILSLLLADGTGCAALSAVVDMGVGIGHERDSPLCGR